MNLVINMTTNDSDNVAVVGAGVIGASWTALFLAAGLRVKVFDVMDDVETKVNEYVKNAWPTLEQLGLTANGNPDNVSFHSSAAEAVENTTFVQENVLRIERLKLRIFRSANLLTDKIVCTEIKCETNNANTRGPETHNRNKQHEKMQPTLITKRNTENL